MLSDDDEEDAIPDEGLVVKPLWKHMTVEEEVMRSGKVGLPPEVW